jgi:hypothetical protein
VSENKENQQDNFSRRGDIIIVHQSKRENVNILRKLSPNVPEDPSISEKSVSEGVMQKGIPESAIINNKNKFRPRQKKKDPSYRIPTASI